jgi:transposase
MPMTAHDQRTAFPGLHHGQSVSIEQAGRRVRRQFSEEFMIGAVRLVLDEGRTVGAVARELDLTPSALANWVRHARAERSHGRTGLTSAEREELTRLRKENRILARSATS